MKSHAITLRESDVLRAQAQVRGLVPALGPVVGWTRPGGSGKRTARVWILPDQMTSDLPVVALTARLKADGEVEAGSVRLWRLMHHMLDEEQQRYDPSWRRTLVPAAHHYAVVDLEFDSFDTVYWMTALHAYRGRRKAGDGDDIQHGHQPMRTLAPGSSPSTEDSPIGERLFELWTSIRSQDLVQVRAPRASRGARRVPRSVRQSEEAPESTVRDIARELEFDKVEDFLQWLAEWVRYDLKAEFDAARRRAEAPARQLISRRSREPRNPSDCEVRLAKGAFCARGSMPIRFAAGTCRYPGVGVDSRLADRALGELTAATWREDAPSFALFVGDQIYVDSFNGVLDIKDQLEKFTVCYQQAFGSPGFKELARRLPLYMVADDHEIKDQWPASLPKVEKRELKLDGAKAEEPYKFAWRTYVGHQHVYAPSPARVPAGMRPPAELPLWYEFAAGPVAFFVLDTRFERELWRDETSKGLMSKVQCEALMEFLAERARDQGQGEHPYAPTFIVSGAVFAPGLARCVGSPGEGRRSDTWQRYPKQRAAVAAKIADLKLQNVVFLSGDYHCTAVGSLAFEAAPGLRAYAIVAPALYAPMPFLNAQAHEIAAKEEIRDMAGARVATCSASARDVQGYASICIERARSDGRPDDWLIRFDVHEPEWSGEGVRPPVQARLENGAAIWLSKDPARMSSYSAPA